jgi:pyruvate dehydrogenase phosphatase
LYKFPRLLIVCWHKYSCSSLLLCVQISRSIGDAYLKSSEFNREPLLARFRIPGPFHKQILCPEPSILEHRLCAEDQFVIFASDGLWEHLSNQEAVDIVYSSPRNVR